MAPTQPLAASSLFNNLSVDQLERVAPLAQERVFPAGEYIFREDSTATELFLVLTGQVLLTMMVVQPSRRVAREVNIVTCGPQKTLGFWALLPPFKYRLSAKATVDVTCLAVDAEGLKRLMDQDKHLAGEVWRGLIHLLMERHDQMAEVLAYERSQRLY